MELTQEQERRSSSSSSSLKGSIKGKPAVISFDDDLFWLNTLPLNGEIPTDALEADICVPHALILSCSIAKGSNATITLITLRLLAPRPSLSFWPFQRASRASRVVECQRKLDQDASLRRKDHLKAQLEGPCTDLSLDEVEVQIDGTDAEDDRVKRWVDQLTLLSYYSLSRGRKLKILINPIGGAGHGLRVYEKQVKPIFEAAECISDVTVTQYVNHGMEVIQSLPLNAGYDAIVCIGGDGMICEVLNGLAQRSDANEAMQIPVAPIPAGSGNAIAHNVLGHAKSSDFIALACLNIIKGKPMLLKVCTVTQPSTTNSNERAKSSTSTSSVHDTNKTSISEDPSTNSTTSYNLHYTFLSQAIGLMAELDLGTEKIRALGDIRFLLGYLRGVIFYKECPVDIYVKFGKQGTIEKQEMRKRMQQTMLNESHLEMPYNEDDTMSPKYLRNGAVTDPLPESMPIVDLQDPTWCSPLIFAEKSKGGIDTKNEDAEKWHRIQIPISIVNCGKMPFVAQDTLLFPYANPEDDCVDLYIHLMSGGRSGLIRTVLAADKGTQVYDQSMVYLKVDAYRIVPRYQAGDARLIQGGLISIDGERRPYSSYQVEVHPSLRLRVLTLYGALCVPDVAPP